MNRVVIERRPVVRKIRGASPYHFALGLDLGQVRDHSAIVVVEQITGRFDRDAEAYIRLQAPEYHSATSSGSRSERHTLPSLTVWRRRSPSLPSLVERA